MLMRACRGVRGWNAQAGRGRSGCVCVCVCGLRNGQKLLERAESVCCELFCDRTVSFSSLWLLGKMSTHGRWLCVGRENREEAVG